MVFRANGRPRVAGALAQGRLTFHTGLRIRRPVCQLRSYPMGLFSRSEPSPKSGRRNGSRAPASSDAQAGDLRGRARRRLIGALVLVVAAIIRSEEHTSELQSLIR